MSEKELLVERINSLTGWTITPANLKIVTDTSEWMNIYHGDIIRVEEQDFLVKGNLAEKRFGIGEQPKYWVFGVIDMADGSEKIIKTVFHEEFIAHFGNLDIRCYRSPEKEGEVLKLVEGDKRFMQGRSYYDSKNNTLRIVDFIKGISFFNYVPQINKSHIDYFHEDLPALLWKLLDSFHAIQFLHHNNQCHGDIRNDHIIIEAETGDYRWIDFDLVEEKNDFDILSLGNIISYAVAKGLKPFYQVLRSDEFSPETKSSITSDDASSFYHYRIMNLIKLYPYIPPKLSNILQHFLINPVALYTSIDEFCLDYINMLETEFPY